MFSLITNIIAPLFGISLKQNSSRTRKASKKPISPKLFIIKKTRKTPKRKTLTPTELLERQQAKIILTQRLQELSQIHNLPYARSFIRDQKTKRGTCSRKVIRRRGGFELPSGELPLCNISLNRRLSKMPDPIRDYVILHELAHTKYMNHGKDFGIFLESLYPERKEAEKRLKEHGMKFM